MDGRIHTLFHVYIGRVWEKERHLAGVRRGRSACTVRPLIAVLSSLKTSAACKRGGPG
jgi:hypothetical protein